MKSINYMKQVAEMLGVELDEKFILESDCGRIGEFAFVEQGLYSVRDDKCCSEENDRIADILKGVFHIVKKPWLPNNNDVYFVIRRYDPTMINVSQQKIGANVWCEETADIAFYATSNCFRTEAEAEAAIPWYEENIRRIKRGEPWEVRK